MGVDQNPISKVQATDFDAEYACLKSIAAHGTGSRSSMIPNNLVQATNQGHCNVMYTEELAAGSVRL